MTRTISLITATVGAALLFAAPAFSDNWGADQRSDSVGYLNPDSADRAAALGQQKIARMLDAREASQTAKLETQLASGRYPKVSERDANTAVATTSGKGTDLPQVGIGFGLGILLAIGLYLAVRFTRVHRLAH